MYKYEYQEHVYPTSVFFFPLTGQQNLIKCNFYSPKNNLLLVKKWAEAALKYIPEKKQYQEKSQGVMLRMFSSVTASFNLITHPHWLKHQQCTTVITIEFFFNEKPQQ